MIRGLTDRMMPFLLAGAAVLAEVIPAIARADEPRRPNVIVILIDDMGWRDLGCYGSTYYHSPHIDRLATHGVRFTNAYAACPVCSPTRAALLTGKYPARLNLTDFIPGRSDRPDQKLLRSPFVQNLPLHEVTLAEVLHDAGYATGQFGKWHLGGVGFEPHRQGFDVSIGGDEDGSPASYFAPFRNARGKYMPGLEQAPDGEYLTDRLVAEATQFIEKNQARPFFLYLPHYAVHIPLKAKPEIAAKYRKNRQPGTQNNSLYAAMIESVDDGVGKLMKKLEDLGLAERTAVFLTSDNGGLSVSEGPDTPATSNAPLREGKGYLYEGGIRVPLIVRWPGVVKTGQISAVPASSIDFFPTILDICGVTSAIKVDGVSLAPMLRGGPLPARDALYWHYPHYSNQGGKPGGVVRSGNFKLIEFYEQGRRELFNLKSDVGEKDNLSDRHPEIVKELAAKLEGWRQGIAARMPRPNPGFVPNPQAADGSVTLPAKTADVHGVQLRYEPAPHKNTLGYWTRAEDWASWEFQLTRPGAFAVEILQGCGPGQGGSTVSVAVGGTTLPVTVEDTGGFQNFKARTIGTVKLDRPGRYELTVKPLIKKDIAVMDLRAVTLTPVNR